MAFSLLLEMPLEICYYLTEELLRIEDLKLLRLACRPYVIITRHTLFRHLTISRMHIDQYRFSRFPLLLVRELLWEELDSKTLYKFCHDESSAIPTAQDKMLASEWRPSIGPVEPMALCHKWNKIQRHTNCGNQYEHRWAGHWNDPDWGNWDEYPEYPDPDDEDEDSHRHCGGWNEPSEKSTCKGLIRWWSDELFRGIKHLYNLKTITIRIRRHSSRQMASRNRLDEEEAQRYLIESLGMTIALLTICQPETMIQNLNLAVAVPQLGHQDTFLNQTRIFEYLTTMSICVFPTSDISRIKEDMFVPCIQAAKMLRKLRLCFPQKAFSKPDPERPDFAPIPWDVVFVSKLFNKPHWRYLRSFHLLSLSRFIDVNNDGHETTSGNYRVLNDGRILMPIANLGPQLCKLQMTNCQVSHEDLRWIRDEQMFPDLESILLNQTIYNGGRGDTIFSTVDKVLAYLRERITDEEFEATYWEGKNRDEYGDVIQINTRYNNRVPGWYNWWAPECWLCCDEFLLGRKRDEDSIYHHRGLYYGWPASIPD
ncbi:hypothetical protein F5Y10DRAFT_262815 [Nemania abortiva]|nr:hypothetical protein F5Y10DRAFT_262815 [Nemania abortiva]